MQTLLDLALSPMPLDAQARISAQIARLGGGDGFIGVWFNGASGAGRCFTAIVFDGVVITWNMFPAPDEPSALKVAQAHHAWAEQQLESLRAGAALPGLGCAGSLH
jgi:hypothetical protein